MSFQLVCNLYRSLCIHGLFITQDRYGATPMIPACNYGHLQVVKYLTQGGADVNKQTKVSFLSFFVSTIYAKVTSL